MIISYKLRAYIIYKIRRISKRIMERYTNRSLNAHSLSIPHVAQLPSLQQAETCWRTNLMLSQQVERVNQRNLNFHKRTSFEQNLINLHIKEMFKAIFTTALSVTKQTLPTNDKEFNSVRQNKQIPQITNNWYLTEEEKLEMTEVILQNQQNFSILMRLGSIFDQNKEELFYILSKLLYYCTVQLKVKEKYNSQKQNVLSLMEDHRMKLIDWMLNQQIVKVINPVFFSNVNEKPMMLIIDNWFYHILCIKQGLYGQNIMQDFGGEDTHFEEEEQNLFQI